MSRTTTIDPIVRSVTVNGTVEHAFRVFTERIAEWWPFERHSVAGEIYEDGSSAVSAEFRMDAEGRGRLVEMIDDGREAEWAEVLAWEPPRRLVLSWHPNAGRGVSTEIEVTFVQEDGTTVVRLEHRGWERMGAEGAAVREGYGEWEHVLGRYARLANAG
jgi:uncharacterized protein YndB with AHSA1/START domain